METDATRMCALLVGLPAFLVMRRRRWDGRRAYAVAGLGLGGEGYLSYSIATTTGEGITTPETFTRTRRCVMVDNLKIY